MSNAKYILLLLIVLLGNSRLVYAEQLPLRFDPPEWNVGEVEIGQVFSKEIRVKAADGSANSPQVSTDITNVRPTCECLKAEAVSSKISVPRNNRDSAAAPQSDGVISATLHIDNTLSAYFRVFFYVHFSDAKSAQQFAKFYITGKVKGKGLPPTEIVVFHTQMAKQYDLVQKRLEAVKSAMPDLTIRDYTAKDIDGYRLRARFEKQYSVAKYADVEMFTAGGAFIGVDDILKELDRICQLRIADGARLPDGQGMRNEIATPPSAPRNDTIIAPKNALEIFYFYSIGCGGCIEIEGTLFPQLQKKFGDKIFVRHLDIGEIKNYLRLIDMEAKYNIKANAPVSVFVGDTALLGSKEILAKTEAVVEQEIAASRSSGARNDSQTDRPTGKPADRIQERFLSFSVLAVIGAGLLDGINPCAFATIIFLISFLTFVGKSKKEIVIVGIFYTMAVFATYLLLGIGIFKAVQSLAAYRIIARIILYAMVGLVFSLAGLSLYDLAVYLRTRKSQGITLQLPLSLKQRIHSVIRGALDSRLRGNDEQGRVSPIRAPLGLMIGALVIGFLVTLFEAVCTGQVYLPTIVFVLKDPQLKLNAFWYLVLYNLMFITPLIIVFGLAYFGVSSERLSAFAQKNIILSKALMALLFIGLGIVLLVL